MKEQILNVFATLGFQLEKLEDMGYSFRYEGVNYLYMPNEEDENFLNIAIPSIIDIDEDNLHEAMLIEDKINSTVKYVKANKFCDGLWLFYERELYGGEDLEKLVSQMILHLEASMNYFRRLMAHITTEGEKHDEDNTPTDDTEEDA